MSVNYSFLYNKVITSMSVTSSMVTTPFSDGTECLFTIYCTYVLPANDNLQPTIFDVSELENINPDGYEIYGVDQPEFGIILLTSKVVDGVTSYLNIPLLLGADRNGVKGLGVVAAVI